MPVINPDYKPDWEDIYNNHKSEMDMIAKKVAGINRLIKSIESVATLNALEQLCESRFDLNGQYDGHLRETQRCLDTYQHATIQDAATYLFENFPPEGLISSSVVHYVDFEKFTTMEDVRQAWQDAKAISEQVEAEATMGLPVGKPEGQDIFMHNGSNRVSSQSEVFTAQELNVFVFESFLSEKPLRTLVTIDHRADAYHICFMQDNSSDGYSALNVNAHIENLADVVYARMQKQKKLADDVIAKNLIQEFMHKMLKRDNISPEQFHFYIHHAPQPMSRERFSKVNMRFENGKFCKISQRAYDVIPELIQQAAKIADANACDVTSSIRRLNHF